MMSEHFSLQAVIGGHDERALAVGLEQGREAAARDRRGGGADDVPGETSASIIREISTSCVEDGGHVLDQPPRLVLAGEGARTHDATISVIDSALTKLPDEPLHGVTDDRGDTDPEERPASTRWKG